MSFQRGAFVCSQIDFSTWYSFCLAVIGFQHFVAVMMFFSTFVLQWCPVYVCYFGFFVVEAIVKGFAFRWGGLGKGFGDEGQWGR